MNPLESDSQSRSRPGASLMNAALRPRTTRAGTSREDAAESDWPNPSGNLLPSPFTSPYQSRAASPIPSKHPSRSSSTNAPYRQHGTLSPSAPVKIKNANPNSGNDLADTLSGLWGKSWTSLQGLASNVLGSDATGETIKDKTPRDQRRRRPLEATHTLHPGQWGPPSRENRQPGAGSKEERMNIFRARKREELLSGSNSLYSASASSHKRRTSDDFESSSAPPSDNHDRDALVYIHRVTPQDTLPGVAIKFSCQLAILKKANRMWSNDAIQARKTLVLPVDACAVKGRPVTSPTAELDDLLIDIEFPADVSARPQTIKTGLTQDFGLDVTARPSTGTSPPANGKLKGSMSGSDDDTPWKHDSWVKLEGHAEAVEIARISRQDLGFFPRTRRKSVSFSDLDSRSSSTEIPRASLSLDQARKGHRKRASSSSEKFIKYMVGPGGVGPLVGKGASAPGPAEDGLSKVFGKYTPKAASYVEDTQEDYVPAGSSSSTSGLENFGSAIEGWMRKLATSAAKVVEPLPSQRSRGKQVNTGVHMGIPSGNGDIELINASELAEEDDNIIAPSSEERGRTRSLTSSGIDDQSRKLKGRNTAAASSARFMPGASEFSKSKGQ